MEKKTTRAFGKNIFLLGVDEYNQKVWLEEPSFDCGWYWGFGYVERYTNNNDPSKAKDITSHTHIDTEFMFDGVIDVNRGLTQTTYTYEEGIKLNNLFTQFYKLRRIADAAHRKDDGLYKETNEIEIPIITKEIINILSKK